MLAPLVLLSFVVAATADCGVPAIQPVNTMIVGGNDATEGSWPWQVGIIKNYLVGSGGYHMCGATLINDQWIVSAAHCFYRWKRLSDYTITVGSHDRDDVDKNQQNLKLGGIWVHEDYNSRTLDNDIAMLKLEQPITFTDYISPACVATNDYPAGTTCVVTGWGDQETAVDDTDLQEVYVPIIDTEVCNRQNWYNGAITDNMFCAGYPEGGQDSCQGDSGGPFVCRNQAGAWELTGVVSWGYGCADALNPGVYTRVTRYNNWINGIMSNN
ncbi:trypsin-2-like [Diadema antillarum]|uniref:trypsin-2-like n=1 Tax=Diadema antillarum TaxID=105358 RepID=UPI003A885B8C